MFAYHHHDEQKFSKTSFQWRTHDLARAEGGHNWGLGAQPSAAKEFLRFSDKKHSF